MEKEGAVELLKLTIPWSSILSFEVVEGSDLQVLDKAVELLLGIFILILLPANSDTHLPGHVSNAIAPQESIQTSVDAHILY